MSPADVYATLPLELRLLALGLRIPVALSVEAFFKGEGLQRSNLLQYDPYGRRLWEPQGGRHSNFDVATLSRMRAALEGFVLARKTETPMAISQRRAAAKVCARACSERRFSVERQHHPQADH
jgi:hypothetical protein